MAAAACNGHVNVAALAALVNLDDTLLVWLSPPGCFVLSLGKIIASSSFRYDLDYRTDT